MLIWTEWLQSSNGPPNGNKIYKPRTTSSSVYRSRVITRREIPWCATTSRNKRPAKESTNSEPHRFRPITRISVKSYFSGQYLIYLLSVALVAWCEYLERGYHITLILFHSIFQKPFDLQYIRISSRIVITAVRILVPLHLSVLFWQLCLLNRKLYKNDNADGRGDMLIL